MPYWESTPSERQWIEHIDAALAAGARSTERRCTCTCPSVARSARSAAAIPASRAATASCPPTLRRCSRSWICTSRGSGARELEFGELHLGGGTPTFLSTEELEALLDALFRRARPARGGRAARSRWIRASPAREQLQLLARYGFRRISLGVQDFDPRVQDIVNRVQSEQQVREVSDGARELGFDSINFDLIYGLPLQTRASVEATMDAVCRLRPDRIALYGYAHVPWIKPGQRRFTEADLPAGRGQARPLRAGARAPGEARATARSAWIISRWRAMGSGRRCAGARLHRNFMGYATAFTRH